MNRDNLRRSLEAHRFYYARMHEAIRPAHEKIDIEQKQILTGLYRELEAMASQLRALEAGFGYVCRPEPVNFTWSMRKANDDPDGDWDDMWANDDPKRFKDHFNRHAKDFGAKNWNDYAKKAQDFYKQGQDEKFPAVQNKDGYTKMYDPKTNTFGTYNPEGKPETFYKPTSPTYFDRQAQQTLDEGGRIINPLPGPENSGGGGLGGGGGGFDPFEKPGHIMHPGDELPEE